MSDGFRTEHTGNPVLDRMQAAVRDLVAFLGLVPMLRGKLITGVVFAAGVAKTIDHGLGRTPRGFFSVRSYGTNVANAIGMASTQPTDTTRQINLITTLASTHDVWFW